MYHVTIYYIGISNLSIIWIYLYIHQFNSPNIYANTCCMYISFDVNLRFKFHFCIVAPIYWFSKMNENRRQLATISEHIFYLLRKASSFKYLYSSLFYKTRMFDKIQDIGCSYVIQSVYAYIGQIIIIVDIDWWSWSSTFWSKYIRIVMHNIILLHLKSMYMYMSCNIVKLVHPTSLISMQST